MEAKKNSIMGWIVLTVLFGYGTANGAVIWVPDNYDKIQEALNAAGSGDTVMVRAGTYVENIIWPSVSGIELRSESGPNDTIIDGNDTGNVISLSEAIIDTNTIIDGFTITNGSGILIEPNYYGGGIYCYESSPTIQNNTIIDNKVYVPTIEFKGYGGGIFCNLSSPTIVNNAISSNRANYGGGIYCHNSDPNIAGNNIIGNSAEYERGGGICCYDGSNPTIINNTIGGNIGWELGGGIYCHNSDPNIINNTMNSNWTQSRGGGIICYNSNPNITGNTISSSGCAGQGGGIYCISSSPTITNNIISNNGDGIDVGGIFCVANSSPIIQNNTISGNYTTEGNGGGIGCISSSPTIISNTIKDNSSVGDGGGIYCNNSEPNITNCILWGNSPDEIYVESGSPIVTYSDVQGGWTGEGNIDADPCFANAGSGDYHLRPGSPCIDAGDNMAVSEPNDLEGHIRIVDGNCNDTELVDMGAYEFDWLYLGDFDGDCDVDLMDYAIQSNYWLTDEFSVDIAPTPAGDGIVDEKDLAVLCDNWLVGK